MQFIVCWGSLPGVCVSSVAEFSFLYAKRSPDLYIQTHLELSFRSYLSRSLFQGVHPIVRQVFSA